MAKAPPAWAMQMMQAVGRLPDPMQQRAQTILMKVMKDQYVIALFTLPIAWILGYVPHFMKASRVVKQTGLEYNNLYPRSLNPDNFGSSSDFIKRAIACHQNALESFPPFAAAVILCKIQKVKPLIVTKLSMRYLLWRALYTLFYLTGVNRTVGVLRSIAWFGGVQSTLQLFKESL
eukprot:TRINITY_DN69923_c0_g1_i1.p1 TRINITY_DN69923_c0_g1~~TRINITY_DN69923_c0_g1_i1.p1  ORF type:complete len:176 (-),score=24.79 TRINITY_DN69923_c0_g1_i1:94-621(-)